MMQKELTVKPKGNQQEAWHGKNMNVPLHSCMIALSRVMIQKEKVRYHIWYMLMLFLTVTEH